jgi:ribosomal protein S18 acetylase RimI-like enzyme
MGKTSQGGGLRIEPVSAESQLACVRQLFIEYATSLGISLCFQNFEQELATLPGKYTPPRGKLLLAYDGDQAVGCVALRELDQSICEMKRLYVRPPWRKHGTGRALAEAIIASASEIGYERMRLDTLATLIPAISLYENLGFQRIPAYYDNPNDGVVFMELFLLKPAGIHSGPPKGSKI